MCPVTSLCGQAMEPPVLWDRKRYCWSQEHSLAVHEYPLRAKKRRKGGWKKLPTSTLQEHLYKSGIQGRQNWD